MGHRVVNQLFYFILTKCSLATFIAIRRSKRLQMGNQKVNKEWRRLGLGNRIVVVLLFLN